ncbi:GNAT family N-acetyltransferase [Aliarcobacter trophiarum LMG 25534]|uniref:Acetyltransferase n=1 Tax=Aliarcobacter trophiarum LMG 25534 TaxID=1032241 RepID=A0AAD0QI67_9BACT|nr:GNAT family N-acetyltransferase [Aliarcobacter trophiarum]AXK48342.1 acetyltransferase [Aliarcobacter trophiarum LMG 25534]RXJ92984.1 GNAT family N-acetyltransferase [Aliarcobacter trophiarum LMG 25534]
MIKKADKNSIENISTLIYNAILNVANTLTGEDEDKKILETLDYYVKMDICRLSYNNIYTYKIENQIVAILLVYNSNDVKKLDLPMLDHLKTKGITLNSFDKECFDDEFYIDTVSVSPDFQGRGIAKELFSFAEKKALELGFKKLSLLVDFENIKAKYLYEKLGFKKNETLIVSGSNFYHMIKEIN